MTHRTSHSRRSTHRRHLRSRLEALEKRILLANDLNNLFANFQGHVNGSSDQFDISINSSDFTLSGGRTRLGFLVNPSVGSSLNPAAVQLSGSTGATISAAESYDEAGSGIISLAIFELFAGDYTVTVSGEGTSSGDFDLGVFLVGDTNGDGNANSTDGRAIRRGLRTSVGNPRYAPELDTNLNNSIGTDDYLNWRRNLGDRTTIVPLTLATSLSPSPTMQPDGTLTTTDSNLQIDGTTVANTTVMLQAGSASSTTTSDGAGNFSFSVTLSSGSNPLSVHVQDGFGQSQTDIYEVTLQAGGDTEPPQLSATLANDTGSPADRVTSDPRVTGSAIDNSGVVTVTASVDGGPDQPVSVDVGGNFLFDPGFTPGGVDDGVHTISFSAADGSGNTNGLSVSLTLDTVAPTLTAALLNDTGASDSDGITSDPTIGGTLIDATGIAVFSAGFDGTLPADFVNLLPDLNPDGSFTLPQLRLEDIFGGPLPDGPHTLNFLAQDLAGNPLPLPPQVSFDLDTAAPTLVASLMNDTGVSDSDGITSDPILAGNVTDLAGDVGFTVSIDGGPDTSTSITIDPVTGNFEFNPGFDLFGPDDGNHSVELTATDTAGLSTSVTVNLTLDTIAPVISAQLQNDTGSSSSDGITLDPTIAGTVDDANTVTLDARFQQLPLPDFFDASGSLNPDGTFTFDPATLLDINGGLPLPQGANLLQIVATDLAGNQPTAPFELPFTLDTLPPQISLTSPLDGATLEDGDPLSGTVSNSGGTAIDWLRYRLDFGPDIDVPLDAGGVFDTPLDLAGLAPGAHILTVTSRDVAGNTQAVPVNFEIAPEAVPLALIGNSPLNGAEEVGVTFRPQIFFNTPVDPNTLSDDNFFASFGGEKLPATIVPGGDNNFAWLFFEAPMPDASLIRVTVIGDTILPEGGGDALDADGDGDAGGTKTFDFETVSLVPVENTRLVGLVVDPGPDMEPHTADDFDPGPDGIPHTDDDVFLLPIGNVEVFLIGLEGEAQFTGADGRFDFGSAPVGNTKLVLDGLTADLPSGSDYYFPEMVMDVNLDPGAINFGMPGMEAMYLPRLPLDILETVEADTGATIVADDISAPNLPPEDRGLLTIEVQPNSLISRDGTMLDNAQIGISTVPPELVVDMLPPGVLQHTFDITVQALGVANFTEPAPMTFPNVFDSPPGTKLNFLSFNHETGRLEIEGTATVTTDGKTVVTDPGTGITSPGWHGLTPPGSQNDPPCDPRAQHTVMVDPIAVSDGIQDHYFDDDTGMFRLSFGNAAQKIRPNEDACSAENQKATPLVIDIDVEGAPNDFLTGLSNQMFGLQPQQQRFFDIDVKDLLTDAKINAALENILYGAKVIVKGWKLGAPGNLLVDSSMFLYRFFDIADDDHTDNTVEFPKTFVDGLGKVFNEIPWKEELPASAKPTYEMASTGAPIGTNFEFRTDKIRFDPFSITGDRTDTLRIKNPDGDVVTGMDMKGVGKAAERVLFSKASLKTAITQFVDSSVRPVNTGGFIGMFPADGADAGTKISDEAGYDAVIDSLYSKIKAGVEGTLNSVSAQVKSAVTVVDSTTEPGMTLNFNNSFTAAGATIASAAHNSDQTGGSIDGTTNIKHVKIFLNVGAVPAGFNSTLKYQHSNDGVTWADLLSTNIVPGDANRNYADSFDNPRRFIRAITDHTTPGTATYGVRIEAYNDTLTGAFAIWDDFKKGDFIVGGGTSAITGGFVHEENKTSNLQERLRFSKIINRDPSDTFGTEKGLTIRIDSKAQDVGDNPAGAGSYIDNFAQRFASTVAHELGHLFGTIHMRDAANAYVGNTLMGQGSQSNAATTSNPSTFPTWGDKRSGALKLALGVSVQETEFRKTWNDYKQFLPYERTRVNSSEVALESNGSVVEPEPPVTGPFGQVFAGPLVLDESVPPVVTSLDFGTVVADGVGGTLSEETVVLVSIGSDALEVADIALQGGTAGFSIESGASGLPTTVPPIDPFAPDPGPSSREIVVRFDPSIVGDASDTLLISSNSLPGGTTSIPLSGHGQSPVGDIRVSVANNNVGGLAVSDAPLTVDNFGTISNVGASNLTITSASLGAGAGQFGVAVDGAGVISNAAPLVLAPGDEVTFDVSFDASFVGLQPGDILFVSDDPDTPVFNQPVVGTGLTDGDPAAGLDYGNDWVAVDTPFVETPVLRQLSDEEGNWQFFLAPEETIHWYLFDDVSGLISTGFDTTSRAGVNTSLIAPFFMASTANDRDGDHLPDDIEFAIGTSPDDPDTNDDGIDDFAAIQQGIDPLGENALPIGIIGTIGVPDGFVQDVVASSDTAYLAAGDGGLQVVDFGQITQPVVIASVPSAMLGGDAEAVDFTSIPGETPGTFRNLVAVGLGTAGIAVVDVTDPPAAFVDAMIPVPGSADAVTIVDNLAYVGGSAGLVTVLDMVSQEIVTTFTASGSGNVSDLAFSGGILYTLRGGRLAAYDVATSLANPAPESTINFGSSARYLFVGVDRAYVTGNQVFEAVDITDPGNLINTSGARPALNYAGGAGNGSGRFVVSTTTGFGGNPDRRASLFGLTDPDDTNSFLTEFNTPGSVQEVWIQNGFALLADGGGGFAIFNFLDFDSGNVAPTVSLSATPTLGNEVVEGQNIRVDVATSDDVQVRNVSLSVNGVGLEPDGSFPFSFFVDVPTLDSGAANLELLVTATDTGGNAAVDTLDLTIVEDSVAPNLLAFLPPDDNIQFSAVQAFRMTFDEPMELSTFSNDSVRIVEAGPDETLGTADDVLIPIGTIDDIDFRNSINLLTLRPATTLAAGIYELQMDLPEITDRAGNPLGTGVFKSQVTVQAIPFNAVIPGSIDTVGEVDLFSFQGLAGQEVTLFANWNPGGVNLSSGQITLLDTDGTTVLGLAEGNGTNLLADVALPNDGSYTVRIRAATTSPLGQGNYNFTISDPETLRETIAYGESLTRNIAVRGDDHEFEFLGTSGDLLNLSYVGPEIEGGIDIFNPDGSLAASIAGGTTMIAFAVPLSQTGTFTFDVDDDTSTGNFTVTLAEGDFADEVAGQFNVVQDATIDELFDVDRFRYTLGAGDEVTVFGQFAGGGRIREGTIRVLDAATLDVLAGPVSGGAPAINDFVNDVARDILVEVRGVSGTSFRTGDYSLTVSDPETDVETLGFGDELVEGFAVRGDDQEWQFLATGGETVTFGYRGPSLGSDFTIKKPDGSDLVTIPNGGTRVSRDLVLDQAGAYTFVLASNTVVGNYTLNLSDPADVESPGTALATNTTQSDTIDTVFDIDVFTYDALAGQSLSVVANWLPGGSNLGRGELELFDPAGTSLGVVSGTRANSISVPSADAGTYVARVRARAGDDFRTGSFGITVFSGAEDPTNDTIATATGTGITPAGASSFNGSGYIGDNPFGVRDVDIFKVEAERGDQIVVDIDAASTGSPLDSYVRIFSSTGTTLAANNNFSGSVDSTLVLTVLDPGEYFVGVSGSPNSNYNPTLENSGGIGSVGQYDVSIVVAQDNTGPRVLSITPTGQSTLEDLTTFTIDFDERLNPDSAVDPNNYALVSAGDDGIFDNGDDVVIALQAPQYNDGLRRVTLRTADGGDADSDADPLLRGISYRLTLKGTETITDIANNPLNDGLDETAFLDLIVSPGVPTTIPFEDGFESGSFGDFWTRSTTNNGEVLVTTENAPTNAGTSHARFRSTGGTSRATLTLHVDLSGVDPVSGDVDLSFHSRDNGDSNQSMPSSFAGRVNADGVAISDDGVNWIRVVDLGAEFNSSYDNFVVDLDGAIRAAGLDFASDFQILFQHYLFNGQTAFIDDIEIRAALAGPTITAISTPGPIEFADSLTEITIDFSEPLQPLGAQLATTYVLQNQTVGGTVSLSSATYDDSLRRVTLTTSTPLTEGAYLLRVRGDDSVGGTTQIRDTDGNLLNNGTDSLFSFELFDVEVSPFNDELDDAIPTGLTPAGGFFTNTTAIGNNDFGSRDVDLYQLQADAGDALSVSIVSNNFGSVGFDTFLRVFDSLGNELAMNDDRSAGDSDSRIDFIIPSDGEVYVGLSSSNNDTYNPLIAPSGTAGAEGKYRIDITLTPDDTAPTVVSANPHAGPNVNQSIDQVTIVYSETIPETLAGDPANYTVTHLGADGVLGGGDDTDYSFDLSYATGSNTATLALTSPAALLPLPIGDYQLLISGAVTDLAGNGLGGGAGFTQSFRVIPTENPLNDRLADAIDTGIAIGGGTAEFDGAVGDNAFVNRDVDLYRIEAREGLRLTATTQDFSIGSDLQARIRLFNSIGTQLTARQNTNSDETLVFDLTAEDTYYLGVSGVGNSNYNPNSPGSGNPSTTTGEYILTITTEDVVSPTVLDIEPKGVVLGSTSQITVDFSEPMDVTGAESPSSYRLLHGGADGRLGTTDDVELPFTAFYNIATNRVTLTTSSPIPDGDVRLTLLADDLVDRAGRRLNGGLDQNHEISVISVGEGLPFFDDFETGVLSPSYSTSFSSAGATVDVISAFGPRRGTNHFSLGTVSSSTTETAVAILAIDVSGVTDLNLSFFAKRGSSEDRRTLPTSFTGNPAGDGVAISVDGNQWYRVVNLASQTSTTYDRFEADLAAAASANGLTLDDLMLLRFSNTELFSSTSQFTHRYFDDIRINSGDLAPVIVGPSPSTLIHAASPTSVAVAFSASLDPASANDAANYSLTAAGPDRILGNADDVAVPIGSAAYDDASKTVTLTTADGGDADSDPDILPLSLYRVDVSASLLGATGFPLNDGLDQSTAADVAETEAAENDTLTAATSTGLTSAADGTFSVETAIGNNSQGGLDVDIYSLEGGSGQRVGATIRRFGVNNSDLRLRLFDSGGNELASTTTTSTNAEVSLATLLTAPDTYYVAVSSSSNNAYDPMVAGSGAGPALGLYSLDIETDTGIAVPPILEGFEDPSLPPYFTTFVSDSTGVAAPSTLRAETGTRSLLLGDTNFSRTLTEAIITVDFSGLSEASMAFQLLRGSSETLDALPATFTDHVNGDGVAFSVDTDSSDGITWHRLFDFRQLANDGSLPTNTFTRFTVDLVAAATAAGVTLTDETQIKFQNYAYGTGSFRGYYIDQLEVAQDVIGPSIVDTVADDTLVVSETLTALDIEFSETLTTASATDAANYELRSDGADGVFGSADDTVFTLTPAYDAPSNTVTLSIGGVGSGLPDDNYRLTVRRSISDDDGNELNDGIDSIFDFAVVPPEPILNDTTASATATGISGAGQSYTEAAFLGNNVPGPVPSLDDVDLYEVVLAAGDALRVNALSGFGTPNMRLRLFDAAGAQVLFNAPTNSVDASLDFMVPAGSGGTFFIGASDDTNDTYDPVGGGGDTGTTLGRYDLSIQVLSAAAFPFIDDFEAGALNPAHWDVFLQGENAEFRVEGTNPTPIAGSSSAVLTRESNAPFSQSQVDLTLHTDLSGQSNVELRFKERNLSDFSSFNTFPTTYTSRTFGSDGVFLSGNGVDFVRIPSLFTGSSSSILPQVIDLDEFAALNGVTLGADSKLRWQTYLSQSSVGQRILDDVELVADTTGPIVTTLTVDNSNFNSTVLNDRFSQFNITVDDRLDVASATNPAAYELLYSGPDGLFPGEVGDTADDSAIALDTPDYDGNFQVTLNVAASETPLDGGRYRLTIKGTGSDPLTDAEGNPLRDGVDRIRDYNIIDTGPYVVSSDPTSGTTIAPSTGFASVDLTFSEDIDPASFDGTDIIIQDDFADVTVVDSASITVSGSGTDWTVSFPALMSPNQYRVIVGPAVTDLLGNPMNQDQDLINGETFDSFQMTTRVSDSVSLALRDDGNYRWDIITDGRISDGGQFASDTSNSRIRFDSYDNMYRLEVAGTTYSSPFNAYAAEDSGRTIRFGSRTLGGVDVSREVYVPETDGEFARFLEVLSNPGPEPVSTTIRIFGDLGSDSATVVIDDGNNSGDLDPGDTFLITDDASDTGGTLTLGHILHDGSGTLPTAAARTGNDDLSWEFPVTIGPGQTIRIMTLATQQADRTGAISNTAALLALPAETLANLSDAEKGTIINFDTGFDTVAPFILETTPDLTELVRDEVSEIVATFSEPLDPTEALDAANYSLLFAGPDGLLPGEPGDSADEVTIPLTPAYTAGELDVTLTIDAASAPLADGRYQLTFTGTTSIEDTDGNSLNGGVDSVFDFDLTVLVPGAFPYTEDFESGTLDLSVFDVFIQDTGGGEFRVEDSSPTLAGSFSGALSKPTTAFGRTQVDLTLNVDLSGASDVELRFLQRNDSDFGVNSFPDSYTDRTLGSDGVFVSDGGGMFQRLPGLFTSFNGSPSSAQSIDLDEFAALNGITLGADTQIRWQAYFSQTGPGARILDNIELVPDTSGPTITNQTVDFGNPGDGVLNDRISMFDLTFDDRLDPTSITPDSFALISAGPDGLFAGEPGDAGDDFPIPFSGIGYDGDFNVLLDIDSPALPLAEGRYLFIATGTGPFAITDAEGNPLGDGVDYVREYTVVDTGPFVLDSAPGFFDQIAPSDGFSGVGLFFNEDVDPASFDGSDVIVINDVDGSVVVPSEDISVSGTGTDFDISFPTIDAIGQYTVIVGPEITDLLGNPMNQAQNLINGEPFDSFSLTVRVSDSDDTTLIDSGNFIYDFRTFDGSLSDGGQNDSGGSRIRSDSYDGMYRASIGGVAYNNNFGVYDYENTSDGESVRTGETLIGGLNVSREIFVPVTGEFARYFEILSNNTSGLISTTVTISGNLGSDSSTIVVSDGNSNGGFDPGDTYLVTDDSSDTGGDLTLGHILQDGDGVTASAASRSGDNLSWTFPVVVPPGQTIRVMTLVTQQEDRASANLLAPSLVDLPVGTLGGLSDDEKGTIVNFDTGFDSIFPVPVGSDPVFDGSVINDDIFEIRVDFSEPLDGTEARDPANYSLIEAGPDGMLPGEPGDAGDEVVIPLTPAYTDGETTVTLTIGASFAPLETGRYRAVLNGTSTLTDVNGNAINDGADTVVDFEVEIFGPSVILQIPDEPIDVASAPVDTITVFFDKSIDEASFTAADVTITDPSGSAVTGISVSPSSGGATRSESFDGALPPDIGINGSAFPTGGAIQLTDSEFGRESGSVIFPAAAIPVQKTEVEFDFRIANDFGGAGMTVAFLHPDDYDTSFVAPSDFGIARNLGYGGVPGRSFAVEIDTSENGQGNDINDNHLGIDLNGEIDSVASFAVGFELDNDVVHTLRVVLEDSLVSIYLKETSASAEITIVEDFDVSAAGLGSTAPLIGFTASTGGVTNDHFVEGVSITSTPPAGTGFEISFDGQSAVGTYTVNVGPDVRDSVRDLAMDQDRDGTVGEASEDVFAGSFTIADSLAVDSPVAGTIGSQILARADLETTLNQSIAIWIAAGYDQARSLSPLALEVSELSGSALGFAATNQIWIDASAGGHGWYLAGGSVESLTDHLFSYVPSHRVDLLSVLLHEVGHLLDLGDLAGDENLGDVMGDLIAPGSRRLPSGLDLALLDQVLAEFE